MEKDKYKIVNNTLYHQDTPKEVVDILEHAIADKTRIRLFYGDVRTGEDCLEIYDTIGVVKRCGENKAPLFMNNSHSQNGTEIFDDCIVKITIDKKTVYEHPSYHLPEIEIREANSELKKSGFIYSVFVKGSNRYNCKSREEAENEVKFYEGLKNIAD